MTARQRSMRRLAAARTALVLDAPFFGLLALHADLRLDPQVQSAQTDGRQIVIGAAFLETLTDAHLRAVIAHEVLHCALGHVWRRETRDRTRWNIACDYAVNAILQEAGFQLPPDACLTRAYQGQSAEWIYAQLPPADRGGRGDGGDGGDGESTGGSDGVPWPGRDLDDPAPEESASTWRVRVEQALVVARGSVPAALARAIAAAQPRVDWRAALRHWVEQTIGQQDQSWQRPARRTLAQGIYLPAWRATRVPALGVAVDTSGSIDRLRLSAFVAEVEALRREIRPTRTIVWAADAAITGEWSSDDPDEPMPASLWVGGGGTSFAPVMQAAAAHGELRGLIYLTDLDGEHGPDPGIPVLWVVPGHEAHRPAPYGLVIRMEIATLDAVEQRLP